MNDMLADSADKLFASIATPAAVRAIERSGDATALWRAIEEAGFCDALVPGDAGGAGLSLHESFGMLLATGRHALPVPLGTTCWARLLLAQRAIDAPAGPIALAAAPMVEADGGWTARTVPFARVADWVVAQRGDTAWLLPTAAAERQARSVHGSLAAHLHWASWPSDAAIELGDALPCLETGAVLCAMSIAGALDKVLDLTVRYANERVQFGRAIGKFQALQQTISEIAELARAATLAAEMGAQAGLPQSSSSSAARGAGQGAHKRRGAARGGGRARGAWGHGHHGRIPAASVDAPLARVAARLRCGDVLASAHRRRAAGSPGRRRARLRARCTRAGRGGLTARRLPSPPNKA